MWSVRVRNVRVRSVRSEECESEEYESEECEVISTARGLVVGETESSLEFGETKLLECCCDPLCHILRGM